jgi:hypothetical protein
VRTRLAGDNGLAEGSVVKSVQSSPVYVERLVNLRVASVLRALSGTKQESLKLKGFSKYEMQHGGRDRPPLPPAVPVAAFCIRSSKCSTAVTDSELHGQFRPEPLPALNSEMARSFRRFCVPRVKYFCGRF